MPKSNKQDDSVGVLLTADVVDKTLYSHSAACQGQMLKLFVTNIGFTHTDYKTETGITGSLATGNQGKGARNWEIISFELAKAEALKYYANEIAKEKETLLALDEAVTSIVIMHPEKP